MAGGVNLIPGARRLARRRRTLTARWIGLGSGYAALLAVAAVLIWAAGRGTQSGLEARILTSQAYLADQERTAALRRAEIAREEVILRINKAVNDQPDWSVLLALVAARLGDEAVLESFLLEPPPQAASAGGAPVYRIAVRGFGRTQAAAAEFALELERTRLFSTVKLVETKRTSFLAGDAIAFTIECTLQESEGAAT